MGIIRTSVDAHTLGLSSLAGLLEDCGYRVMLSDGRLSDAVTALERPGRRGLLLDWIRANGITRLGFSYRLDPSDARDYLGRIRAALVGDGLYGTETGQIRALYFAGPPASCSRVASLGDPGIVLFSGGDSASETLRRLGVPTARVPADIRIASEYDDARLQFGRELIASGRYLSEHPPPLRQYPELGGRSDGLALRLRAARESGRLPLLRAHAGPYDTDRAAAIRQFMFWVGQLRRDGHLDILSLGTSQLTQERFEQDWSGIPNGGGLPINSRAEYAQIAAAARPMLVRTYAGSSDVPLMARIHEESLNIAWHALSLWWFSRIDGRGPNSVARNLQQHLETVRFIAESGKPLEANVPHHFSFRGGDDVTYIVSGFLAARAAKRQGIRMFVLQVMLNTPRSTSGVQDLARARALLRMVRALEDDSFTVILQPRAGLDYFSPDLELARAQLAAATALMCDIEPDVPSSPPLIHVVSYSEGHGLASPEVITESLRIVRHTIRSYSSPSSGKIGLSEYEPEVAVRSRDLLSAATLMVAVLDRETRSIGEVARLYVALSAGFLAAPTLWGDRDEFVEAIRVRTRVMGGAVRTVDSNGHLIPATARAEVAGANVPAALRRLQDA